MDKMINLLKPKPNPQQQLRDWQRRLKQECRNIERQIRNVQREEKNVQKAIRDADADKGHDMVSAKSADIMKLVNNLMKAPEVAATMQEFSKEMTKAGVIEEMVNDAVDPALDSEDIEEETEKEVNKVLTEIAGETAAQLPEAVSRERIRQPAETAKAAQEEEAMVEGVDDEEELQEIRDSLAKVRS